MKFWKQSKNFCDDETGAITVDWVVITAGIVGVGLAVVATIKVGVNNAGFEIGSSMASAVK